MRDYELARLLRVLVRKMRRQKCHRGLRHLLTELAAELYQRSNKGQP